MRNKKTLSRVLSLVKKYRGFAVFSIFFALISVLSQLYIPILCGDAIDRILDGNKSEFVKNIIIISAVAIFAAVSQRLFALCNNKMTYSLTRDIRVKLNEKINKLPVSYIDSHSEGDFVSRMVSDVDTLADGLLMGFTQLFTGVITILSTLVIMLLLNPVIAITVIVLTPLSILVAKFIAGRTHKYFNKQAKIRGEQTSLVNELVSGQREVRAFGYEDECLEGFDEVNGRFKEASLGATFYSSLVNPTTRLINNVVYAVVVLISSFYSISGMGMTVGTISVFLNYAGQYAKPFNEISGVIAEFQNALASAARIFEVLDEEELTPDVEAPLDPEALGVVKLDNIAFSYTKDKPLIEGLSLDVKAGQRIAIVGPTGCGKTTLINLLMRFYDVNDGAILVDGADVRKMTRKNLRSRFGMVLQDTWLSSGTIKENIAYGKPDATDEEIITAAKSAHAHSFIRRLPNGYDTVIKGNGSNLSQGQRQLICIARAMLCLPQMLILDEATSSIDTRTEQKIQRAFNEMMNGRTSFVVAHRLSTIKEADVILVMKDGKVIEKGSHEELLKLDGFYTNLYNSQFSA